jgi:hypothetical protein
MFPPLTVTVASWHLYTHLLNCDTHFIVTVNMFIHDIIHAIKVLKNICVLMELFVVTVSVHYSLNNSSHHFHAYTDNPASLFICPHTMWQHCRYDSKALL